MGMGWVGYRREPAQARQILADPGRTDELFDSDDETSIDLDKAWHGLHWLLTGTADPTAGAASDAIFGGEPIGEDLGYGAPRLLEAPAVAAVAATMQALDAATLGSRMDGAAMEAAEVYPMIWDEEDVFEEYLAPSFEDLRDFYVAAASAGQAVIQTVT